MITQEEKSDSTIELAQRIKADVWTVWQCLTEPAHLKEWWGPGVRLDPREGGDFEEIWTDEEGEQHRTTGKILASKAPNLLRLSWREAEWDRDTEVGFRLVPAGAETEVQLRHGNWHEFPEEKRKGLIKEFRQGWTDLLLKLKQRTESSL